MEPNSLSFVCLKYFTWRIRHPCLPQAGTNHENMTKSPPPWWGVRVRVNNWTYIPLTSIVRLSSRRSPLPPGERRYFLR